MTLLVAGAARRGYPCCGDFISPRRRRQIGQTPTWAADNDAFSGFDQGRYVAMLKRIAAAPVRPRFVTLPDVVCDHQATLDLWSYWHRVLASADLPRAFVLQNGVPEDWKSLPWDYFEALFIGGDDAFKLGPRAAYFARAARCLGKWVHMGRVNSVQRLRHAIRIGCQSCDGSGMARFPDSVLRPMVDYLMREEQEVAAGQLILL